MVPRRYYSLFVFTLIFMLIIVSCKGERSSQAKLPESQPTKVQATWTPVTEGSANLHYQLVTKNLPFYTAVETDVIPLKWKFDPDHPKRVQEIIGGINNGSFFVQIAGTREGDLCFFWFDIPAEIDIFGRYKPGPNCSFDFSITANPGSPISERGQNCGAEAEAILKQYPAEILFIPPPNKVLSLSEDLTITIPVDDVTTIKLTLTDVVVSEFTGCQW